MARRAIVGAVLVLTRELTIEFESDEHLQAQILEQLQDNGKWNRHVFRQSGAWVEIAEVATPQPQVQGADIVLQQQQAAS